MSSINNANILVGSTTQVVNKRMVLGEKVDTSMVSLINNLFKSISYANKQLQAGNLEYANKIAALEKLVFKVKYACPDICNYREFGQLIDFRASNATITVDTLDYRVSQLQIIM